MRNGTLLDYKTELGVVEQMKAFNRGYMPIVIAVGLLGNSLSILVFQVPVSLSLKVLTLVQW